jgi:hypothetical protein
MPRCDADALQSCVLRLPAKEVMMCRPLFSLVSLPPDARVKSETQPDFIRPNLLQVPRITLINHAEPAA